MTQKHIATLHEAIERTQRDVQRYKNNGYGYLAVKPNREVEAIEALLAESEQQAARIAWLEYMLWRAVGGEHLGNAQCSHGAILDAMCHDCETEWKEEDFWSAVAAQYTPAVLATVEEGLRERNPPDVS